MCTRQERNDEWRAGKDLPFGLPLPGGRLRRCPCLQGSYLAAHRRLASSPQAGQRDPRNEGQQALGHRLQAQHRDHVAARARDDAAMPHSVGIAHHGVH